MRKIIVEQPGPPEVMKLVEGPDPVAGPGEVVVRNHSCSVAGPDILIRSNRYRFQPKFPLTLGNDASCVVESVGPGVTEFKVGDGAYLSWRAMRPPYSAGFYTDRMLAPVDALQRLPAGMDLELAANIGAYTASWAMLVDAPAGRTIRSVLIVGGSGVHGTAQTHIARHLGMTVITLVSSDEKAAYSKANGAHHTINYRTENIVERVRALTDGEGVDLIVDHLGGPNFTDYFDMLAKWGTIVSINGVEGTPAKDTFEEGRNHAKLCISICFFAMYAFQYDPVRRNRLADAVIPLMMDGTFKPRTAKTFSLEEAAEAHRLLESGQALGRIFLKP